MTDDKEAQKLKAARTAYGMIGGIFTKPKQVQLAIGTISDALQGCHTIAELDPGKPIGEICTDLFMIGRDYPAAYGTIKTLPGYDESSVSLIVQPGRGGGRGV